MIMTNNKFRYISIIALALLFSFIIFPLLHLGALSDYISFALGEKEGMNLSIVAAEPGVNTIAADSENVLLFKVRVTDKSGLKLPGAKFIMSASLNKNAFSPTTGYTDKEGTCQVIYRPSQINPSSYEEGKAKETINVTLAGTNIKSQISFNLIHVPVVLIHGYQANSTLFDSFKEFLEKSGFPVECFDYESESGVANGAKELESFLAGMREKYSKKGIQIKRFDLIGHSMGGLVARYYTCRPDYDINRNVEKLIFISVPQNGSVLASLGLKYYTDKGIRDLVPDSTLFTDILPKMINRGLNNRIQTGSIIGQYDEVVSIESASLEEWGIKTELFNVGENNFTIDKLLSGKITEAANHKSVLYNKKIFNRVREMLDTELPFPKKK